MGKAQPFRRPFHARAAARFARGTTINAPLALGIGTRLWMAASWLLTLHFVAADLSAPAQGYYFTFNSLSQLTQFVDLGLQILIVQFASHEAARLAIGRNGAVTGDAGAISRLASLGRFSLGWYGAGSCLLVPALLVTGRWLFGTHPDAVDWRLPWLMISGLAAIDLMLNNFVWLLEGVNNLTFVYSYRLARGLVVPVATWLFLDLGLALWAVPLSLLAGIAVLLAFLLFARARFVLLFFRRPRVAASISWRREIMPLQWRLGISTVAGFATYYLFVPVIFKFVGPVAAGQFGMTATLIDGMTSIALLWLAVKFPTMGALAARRAWTELDRLAFRSGAQAFVVTCAGAAIIVALGLGLHFWSYPLAQRLLPMAPLAILAITAPIKVVQGSLVYFLRAHRQEPVAGLSAFTAPLMVGVVVLGALSYGALGVAAGYGLTMALVMLPATGWITISRRALWHSVGPDRIAEPVRAAEPVL
jgi:O-antigen/teichoic acid export membrane protein